MLPNEYEEIYKEVNYRIMEFMEISGIMPKAIYLGTQSAIAIEIYAGNLKLYVKKGTEKTFKGIPIYIIHGIQHNKYIGVGI